MFDCFIPSFAHSFVHLFIHCSSLTSSENIMTACYDFLLIFVFNFDCWARICWCQQDPFLTRQFGIKSAMYDYVLPTSIIISDTIF